MPGIALMIAAVLVATPAVAQNCLLTKLRVDCGDAGDGMRTDRGGVWWGDGSSTTLDSSAFERDRRRRRDVERRGRRDRDPRR